MTTERARVFPFLFRGDESKPMRVVVRPDGFVIIEHLDGCDAVGVERWRSVDLEAAAAMTGRPLVYPHEWVSEAVRAVLADALIEVQP